MRPLAAGEQIAAFAASPNPRLVPMPATCKPGQRLRLTAAATSSTGPSVISRTALHRPDADGHGPDTRPADPDGKITAFLVTPDMPGFEVVEARMPKCGIKGTATALAFHDMYVPKENVLGQVEKGLK